MKNLKKIMAIILVAMMTLSLFSVMAYADNPDPGTGGGDNPPAAATKGSITIKPSSTVTLENKTLKAYKILDATYGVDESGKATINEDGKYSPISYTIPQKMTSFFSTYFTEEKTIDVDGTPTKVSRTGAEWAAYEGKTLDVYVTEQMKDWGDDSAKIKDFAAAALAAAKTAGVEAITGTKDGDNVKFADLDAGYYVIEDEGAAVPISAVMLDTVADANIDITLKASDDSTKEIMTAEDLVNSKANELGLGRAVNFKVTQKIPDTTGYDYYYYMINDTLSEGLTFNPESVKVVVSGPAVADDPATTDVNEAVAARENVELSATTSPADYYLYSDKETQAAVLGDKTFIIAFEDIVKGIAAKKYLPGDTITITYTATVNSDAVVGVDPNTNKANVEFSNNPDKDGRGDKEGYPGIPANTTEHPTGVGPDKWTDTYTTKVTIIKVDGANSSNPLAGVEFTLTGTAKDAVFKAEEVFEIDPTGDYWLLNDGTYTKTAPTTEAEVEETTGGAGWVEIPEADATTANTNGIAVRKVGGKYYRPYVENTDSSKTRYIIVEANNDDYASVDTKYSKVTKTADAAEDYKVTRSGVTGSDGKLDFSQLGAGTYKLSETGILAGYNGIADIDFTITCTLPDAESVIAGDEKATWTITSTTPGVTFTEVKENDEGTGIFEITIENNKGTELPSTGGIGTTIFYVVGSVLVIGTGIVLVTRKRMGKEN
jgi:fimbrial isopeptide formation D2 family protein/LPXTG-motif cell wall-anchored protein